MTVDLCVCIEVGAMRKEIIKTNCVCVCVSLFVLGVPFFLSFTKASGVHHSLGPPTPYQKDFFCFCFLFPSAQHTLDKTHTRHNNTQRALLYHLTP